MGNKHTDEWYIKSIQIIQEAFSREYPSEETVKLQNELLQIERDEKITNILNG